METEFPSVFHTFSKFNLHGPEINQSICALYETYLN